MIVVDRANLSPERLTELSRELMELPQLYRVLDWYRHQQRLTAMPEVINQDEYSLDVIFDQIDNLYLVFGTT